MSKLLVALSILVLMLGLALFIFRDGARLNETVLEGHEALLESVRSFDYVSD